MTTKERNITQSVGFRQSQLKILDKLIQSEGGSISSHTREAVDDYFKKKGIEPKKI